MPSTYLAKTPIRLPNLRKNMDYVNDFSETCDPDSMAE